MTASPFQQQILGVLEVALRDTLASSPVWVERHGPGGLKPEEWIEVTSNTGECLSVNVTVYRQTRVIP